MYILLVLLKTHITSVSITASNTVCLSVLSTSQKSSIKVPMKPSYTQLYRPTTHHVIAQIVLNGNYSAPVNYR